jgi:hypothetical protein
MATSIGEPPNRNEEAIPHKPFSQISRISLFRICAEKNVRGDQHTRKTWREGKNVVSFRVGHQINSSTSWTFLIKLFSQAKYLIMRTPCSISYMLFARWTEKRTCQPVMVRTQNASRRITKWAFLNGVHDTRLTKYGCLETTLDSGPVSGGGQPHP